MPAIDIISKNFLQEGFILKKVAGVLIAFLLILLCAVALADVAIDETHFPDAEFREFIKKYDTDGNGSFNEEEIREVRDIN